MIQCMSSITLQDFTYLSDMYNVHPFAVGNTHGIVLVDKIGRIVCNLSWSNKDEDDFITMYSLSVDPRCRREGLATLMVKRVQHNIKILNRKLLIWTKADSWELDWFLKMGFRKGQEFVWDGIKMNWLSWQNEVN